MKTAVIILVILASLLVGCAPSVAMPTNSIVTQVSATLKTDLTTRLISISEVPKIFVDRTAGSDGIYPPEIVMGNVNYGDEISVWFDSIPELGIKNGDPISLCIFNRTGEEVTYNISYKMPEKVLEDSDGNGYEPLAAAVFWIEFSDKTIIVPAEMVASISVRMIIPEKSKEFSLPDRWAFQIYVKPIEGGNIQRAYLQNWLVNMR